MIDCKSGRLAIWLSYHYMQETEVRDMTLPEGHTVSLEMWRIHWVLYDRLCEHLDFFEKNIPKVLVKYRDKGNEEMNLQLVDISPKIGSWHQIQDFALSAQQGKNLSCIESAQGTESQQNQHCKYQCVGDQATNLITVAGAQGAGDN